jgi:hypothetical protein
MDTDFFSPTEVQRGNMDRSKWIGTIVGIQLTNALLLFTFSIYLTLAAYPVVTFFQERSVTITYIGNVAIFVVLGALAIVGGYGLRKQQSWGLVARPMCKCCHLCTANSRFTFFGVARNLFSACSDCFAVSGKCRFTG